MIKVILIIKLSILFLAIGELMDSEMSLLF